MSDRTHKVVKPEVTVKDGKVWVERPTYQFGPFNPDEADDLARRLHEAAERARPRFRVEVTDATLATVVERHGLHMQGRLVARFDGDGAERYATEHAARLNREATDE